MEHWEATTASNAIPYPNPEPESISVVEHIHKENLRLSNTIDRLADRLAAVLNPEYASPDIVAGPAPVRSGIADAHAVLQSLIDRLNVLIARIEA